MEKPRLGDLEIDTEPVGRATATIVPHTVPSLTSNIRRGWVLDSSATSFNKQSNDVAKTEVDGKTEQINQLSATIQLKQKEIADLQQQVKAMQSEVDVSRSKLQQAKANFGAAFERRKAEIQQQRKDFENILQ